MATGSFLDFGDLSLEDARQLKAKQVEMLNILGGYMEEASAFTKSGRDIPNPSRSKAVMMSASKSFPLEAGAEGKTVSDVIKHMNFLTNDNAMLDAIIAAKTPVPPTPAPARPPTPPARPSLASKLNPILAAVDLLTYSADLNEGEDEELAKRRANGKGQTYKEAEATLQGAIGRLNQ